jgi:hypothetical protein
MLFHHRLQDEWPTEILSERLSEMALDVSEILAA